MRFPVACSALAAVVAASAAFAAHAQPDYTHYVGVWQGQFLFYVAKQDTGAQGPPQVHAGTMQIGTDGAVDGSIAGATCVLKGSSTDYVSPANASIDVLLSGCKDTRFNGRFTGKLINNPVLRYASLRLSSMRSLDDGTAQLSAIIRH